MRMSGEQGGFSGIHPQQGVVMDQKKAGIKVLLFVCAVVLAACQANYVRDVQGGTVAPSQTVTLSSPIS